MSKSAPTTPSRAFREPDSFEPRLKLQFNRTVDPETNSDSEAEPASPKAAFSFLPHNFAGVNADYDEQKERSDDEEAESYYNSEQEEGDDEGDYEGEESCYEGDEGDNDSDEGSALETLPLTEVIFEPCGKRGRDENFKEPQGHEVGGFNPKYYKSESAQSFNNNRVPSSIVFLKAYEEGVLFFPTPLSPEVLHSSSSSASASPSDFGIPVLPDSPTSPFPPLLEASSDSNECFGEELLEQIKAQRARDVEPRGEWEDEYCLCEYLAKTGISSYDPVEAAGEAMQFGDV